LGVDNVVAFGARTYGELDDAFTAAAAAQDRMVFIEAVLPKMDIPELFTELAESAAAANAGVRASVSQS
jgi:indolepyruvate decarboxylase